MMRGKRITMHTVYTLHANELDMRFIESLKALFGEREIEIAVCEASERAEDETEYLLRSPANRDRLLQAVENVNQHRNLVTVNLNDLS